MKIFPLIMGQVKLDMPKKEFVQILKGLTEKGFNFFRTHQASKPKMLKQYECDFYQSFFLVENY